VTGTQTTSSQAGTSQRLSPPTESSLIMDPVRDRAASDEIEFFCNALAWGLRGVYPQRRTRRSET
jgi:hypothetical protein